MMSLAQLKFQVTAGAIVCSAAAALLSPATAAAECTGITSCTLEQIQATANGAIATAEETANGAVTTLTQVVAGNDDQMACYLEGVHTGGHVAPGQYDFAGTAVCARANARVPEAPAGNATFYVDGGVSYATQTSNLPCEWNWGSGALHIEFDGNSFVGPYADWTTTAGAGSMSGTYDTGNGETGKWELATALIPRDDPLTSPAWACNGRLYFEGVAVLTADTR